jgi:HAE1 family hydrophobic/amphiphilic exporter-1
VPVSLIGAFLLFPLFGFSVNTLSLFALVLAIGLVIDDAIVVVEAVEAQIEHGAAPAQATLAAMKLVSGPVVAIALILAAVFIPVGLSGGITGRLHQQFALTIATSVLISAFSALTLSPALSAKMLRPRRARRGPLAAFFRRFDRVYAWGSGHYVRGVDAVARRPWLGVVLLLASAAGAWLVAGLMRTGFLPEEDEGYFFIAITLPPASSLDRTDEVLRRVDAELADVPGIDTYVTVAGFSIVAGVSSPFQGTAFVRLKPWGERKSAQTRIEGILARVGKDLGGMPQARVLPTRPAPIPGLGTTGGVGLYVQDVSGTLSPPELEAAVQQFVGALRQRPEVGSAITTLQASVPQRRVVVDEARILQRGVPIQDVYATLSAFLGGQFVNQFTRFGRVWNVYVQAEAAYRMSADSLRLFAVRDGQGNMVPLSELVRIEDAVGPEFLNRFNLYRAGQVLVNPSPGNGTADVMRAVTEVAAQALPRTMAFEWSDLARQQANAPSAVPIFVLAIVIVFLVLAALYESWSLPFSVLLSTPIAVLGAFLGLVARGLAFDVYAQIGLVMLVGLAAKNAILIVEYARSEVQAGRDPRAAAVDATRIRLRPILMTSFAFILGCVPLWFASGAGAEARRILGTVVVTGMLLATLVAPLVVPALFVLVERVVAWRHRGAT